MDFGAMADSVWKQIVTVWNAPVPFIAVVLLASFIIWKIVQREYSNRLADAASRLDLSHARVQDYERQLSGASPVQAREQIERLETRLNELEPRRVTAEQREKMRAVLTAVQGRISIGSDMACTDASQFRASISAAFRDAGWAFTNPSFMGLGNPPMSGLGLRVPDPDNMRPTDQAVAQGLRAAGLVFDIQRSHPRSAHGGDEPDIEIVITPRVMD